MKGTFLDILKSILNSAKHLLWCFCGNSIILVVEYFRNKFPHKYLTVSWIKLRHSFEIELLDLFQMCSIIRKCWRQELTSNPKICSMSSATFNFFFQKHYLIKGGGQEILSVNVGDKKSYVPLQSIQYQVWCCSNCNFSQFFKILNFTSSFLNIYFAFSHRLWDRSFSNCGKTFPKR